jgi:peroxiredoxin
MAEGEINMRLRSVSIAFLLITFLPICSLPQESAHPSVPEFSLQDESHHAVSLADYQGNVVVISFWKPSCILCQKQIAVLTALQEKYRSQGLSVMNLTEDPNATKAYHTASSNGNIPLILADKNTLKKFGSPMAPTLFLVGRDSRVYSKHSDYISLAPLEQELKQLLSAKSTTELAEFKPSDNPEKIMLLSGNELNTDIPGIELTKLNPAQIKLVSSRLDAKACPCGCGNTMLSCRRNHGSCQMSLDAARSEMERALK